MTLLVFYFTLLFSRCLDETSRAALLFANPTQITLLFMIFSRKTVVVDVTLEVVQQLEQMFPSYNRLLLLFDDDLMREANTSFDDDHNPLFTSITLLLLRLLVLLGYACKNICSTQ